MHVLDAVLHVSRTPTPQDLEDIKGMGLKVVARLDTYHYRIRGTTEAGPATLETLSFVTSAAVFEASRKLDKKLRTQSLSASVTARAAAGDVEPISVLVSLDPDADPDATVNELGRIGEVKDKSPRRALIAVLPGRLQELASLPGVLAAEVEPVNKLQNNVGRTLTGVVPTANDMSLDGSGEIVGVADSGLDNGVNDASILDDFQGRIVNIRATVDKSPFGVADGADLNNHGTHVTGSILGNGSHSNGNLAGMAPAAQVTMLAMGADNGGSVSVPWDLTTGVFQDAYNDGARLHNNSWSSTGSAGAYEAYANDVDEFILDNPDMLIVYAAGNDGDGVGSVTSPGTAKNCLTVGACESERLLPAVLTLSPNMQDTDFNLATPNESNPLTLNGYNDQADDVDDIADFSGRGPTDDGRIAPDIVAPGTFILSCRSSVSTADLGPDGFGYFPPITGWYANDADGVATHAEAVGRGLPGAPFYGTWDQNTPSCPPGSGATCQDNYFYNSGTSMAAPITTGCLTLLRLYLRQQRGLANPTAALMKALLINGATVPSGDSNNPDNDRGFGWVNMINTLQPQPTGRQAFSDDVDLAVATGDIRSFNVQLAGTGHPFRVTLVWSDRQGAGIQNHLYLRVITPGGAAIDGDVTAFPLVTNNVQRVHIETPAAGVYTVEVHGVSVAFGIDAHLPAIRQDFGLAVNNGLGFSPKPSDVCQVIDKSGSMGFYGYMDPVKERAKQFIDVLRINDRAGAAAFNHTAALVHAVVSITGFDTKEDLQTSINTLTHGGNTSIGAGLQQGLGQLTAGGDPTHHQGLVLLSDGHENTPPWVGGGTTDSPPGWYSGPDTTEILPTLPSDLPVYTVSLGVQSDMVLLQEIAALTGGVFHAVHSAADIGKLHEIYIHLQALTGGEEVITSGESSLSGINISGSNSNSEEFSSISGLDNELKNIVSLRSMDLDPVLLGRLKTWREHEVHVDETMESITLMVSWHERKRPVGLTVVTPSGKVLKPGTRECFNHIGSSHQYFQVEKPKPGIWLMRIRAHKRREPRTALVNIGYTYGAYGRSPLRLHFKLPKKLFGARKVKIGSHLEGQKKFTRNLRYRAYLRTPYQSTPQLIKRYRRQLAELNLDIKPDTPKLKLDVLRLVVLDKQLREKGKKSLFRSRPRRLHLTMNNSYTNTIKTPVAGLHNSRIGVSGTSRGGYKYERLRIFDVRT
jgi:hypothetical protein